MPVRLFVMLCLIVFGCTEPTEPRFQLEEPFYLVEGDIADQPDFSEIRISRSRFSNVQLTLEQVTDAAVTTTEALSGEVVIWSHDPERPGTYIPPPGFVAQSGEVWSATVSFPDGSRVVSLPERLPDPVDVEGLRVVFDQEGEYDRARRIFVPLFRILLDYTDPAGTANSYQWDFRYWEEEFVCATCIGGVYRGGSCIARPVGSGQDSRYDYACAGEETCFQQTRGHQFKYGSDRAFNGSSVRGQEIGTIEFTTYGGLLVEGILYSLTAEAYNYGRVVADIVEGNSGLNATIPAALIGNMRDPDNEDRQVLGFVRAVSVATQRRYLLRDVATGTPSPNPTVINYEPPVGLFVPPRAPCRGEGRSPGKPAGWP
ncbi:DUF4249 family protein [Lewinella sp. JB7]|uniref:DUF4249 family protein n=1 Tax=Lewinella sp. JB7 TaxID=2962887 RepID=UPI0020CA1D6B|nr:DUF4249 family protein [Lewinella sp. JB7]MCP9236467.1 DUF4249 domain-containing protein [Lewinella sp. JB7]